MKKLLLLFAAAALAAATILLLLRTQDPPPADPVDAEAGSGGQARAATAAASTAAEPGREAPRPGVGDERERVETANPESAPMPTVRVTLQDSETQQPVPDAEAFCLETDQSKHDAAQRELQRALQQDAEPVARRSGKAFRSDARGEVHVPRPGVSAIVTARKGDLYGEAWLKPRSDEPVVLALVRDSTLEVRALDSQRVPQVGVAIRIRTAASRSRPAWDDSGAHKTEAPSGIARLAHLQRQFPSGRGGQPTPSSMVAYACIPGVVADTAAFDPKRPPAEPLELVVPDCGSVAVKVTDADGNPCREDGWISLSPNRDEDQQAVAQLTAGQARFARIALGLRLRVAGGIGETELEAKDVPGPARAGEEVSVVLQLSRTQPILVGKAVDAAGQPLAARHLVLVLGSERNGTDQLETKTEPDGRFRFLPDKDKVGQKLTRLSFVVQEGSQATGSFARGSLPRTLIAGVQDLGELAFHEAPLLVAGTVFDETGKPFAEAQVAVQRRAAPDQQGRRGQEQLALHNADVVTQKRDEGRFEVRGDVGESELTLSARHPDAVPQAAIPFTRGEPDLRVVLARGGSIKVTLQTDPGLSQGEVRLSLRNAAGGDARDGASRNFEWMGGGPQGRGPATRIWRGLAPGTYELVARLLPEDEVMRSLTGLVVVGGASCSDPRLAPFDLRGLARKIELTAVDAAGKTVEQDGTVHVKDGQSVQLRKGKAQLWITRSTVDVTVAVGNFRKKSYAGIAADASLRLEDGYAVRVKLAGLERPAEARVSLRSRGMDPGMRGMNEMPDGDSRAQRAAWEMMRAQHGGTIQGKRDEATGEWAFTVPEARAYPVSVQVRANKGTWSEVQGVAPAEIAVQDAAGQQAFEVVLAKEAVEKALGQSARAKR